MSNDICSDGLRVFLLSPVGVATLGRLGFCSSVFLGKDAFVRPSLISACYIFFNSFDIFFKEKEMPK